ncbi:MAG: signal recognition particle-docking protein FtsY [Chlamydiota bacterium]|nr:signal recognition particle-docking protein FtsY [Chlamydiota bacterium]
MRKSWKKFLQRTTQKLALVFNRNALDNQNQWDELEAALISTDIGVDLSSQIIDEAREHFGAFPRDQRIFQEHLIRTLQEGIEENSRDIFTINSNKPRVVIFVGVNGAGKTTTLAKFAHQIRLNGQKAIIGACDTFRAAAIEQIQVWSLDLDFSVVHHQYGADPSAVAFDTIDAAIARNIEWVLIDTAGRLHDKVPLMIQLEKIVRICQRKVSTDQIEIFLVLDATTGQNAIGQAQTFQEKVKPTGIILSKLDGSAKGGVVIQISQITKIPVVLVGIGEGIEDLVPFDKKAFIEGMFSLET